MQYRPEVDGLRALAVLPVILYHAKLPYFQGGFVGVDVFVISGYLITEYCQKYSLPHLVLVISMRGGKKDIACTFCVLTLITALAWILLPPSELKDFEQSLFSVSFISNFFWMKELLILELILSPWSILGLAVKSSFIFYFLFLFYLFTDLIESYFPLMFLSLFISLYLAHISDPSQ